MVDDECRACKRTEQGVEHRLRAVYLCHQTEVVRLIRVLVQTIEGAESIAGVPGNDAQVSGGRPDVRVCQPVVVVSGGVLGCLPVGRDEFDAFREVEDGERRVLLLYRLHPHLFEADTADAQVSIALTDAHHLLGRRVVRLGALSRRDDAVNPIDVAGDTLCDVTLWLDGN